MKKKIFVFLSIFIAFITTLCIGVNVHAEGEPQEEQVETVNVVGVYEYVDEENGDCKFTLYSDNTFKAVLHDVKKDETIEGEGTYIIDGTTLIIKDEDNDIFKFTINGNKLEPIAEEYPCKVVGVFTSGGDVMFDKEYGNVGDIITFYAKPDFLFNVSLIKINGEEIKISKDGKYQFELVEGNNVVTVDFKINNEKLTEIADLINGVKEEGFASLFTVSNLLNLITWAVGVLLSSGFFITLIKSKKLKAKTVDEVVDVVKSTLKDENAKILLNFLKNLMKPTLDKITLKMDSVDECMKVLCRCILLSQDDTPQNRLAIIEELTKLQNNDETLTEQIRSIVKQEQKAQEEKIIARDKAIEELKENNAKLVEEEDDSYGQI